MASQSSSKQGEKIHSKETHKYKVALELRSSSLKRRKHCKRSFFSDIQGVVLIQGFKSLVNPKQLIKFVIFEAYGLCGISFKRGLDVYKHFTKYLCLLMLLFSLDSCKVLYIRCYIYLVFFLFRGFFGVCAQINSA